MTEADTLSIEQQNAIDLLILGKPDREVAEEVGVSRPTVTDWRNHNEHFAAELNRRRQELWGAQTERLRALVAQAVDALEENLSGDDPALRQAAAVHVLRAVKLYGTNLHPTGHTTPEEVREDWAQYERSCEDRRRLAELLRG
jgi:hypothetical protein